MGALKALRKLVTKGGPNLAGLAHPHPHREETTGRSQRNRTDQFRPSPSCFFLQSKGEEKDMGWDYPDISLEEMVNLVKGFVDILILASGYQSSGLLAHWDSHNIKKAFQWASFFETVLNHMSSSGLYQGPIKELDAALSELTSDPSFPQGLRNLSSGTLNSARNFVLAHLLHTMPLRDSHLRAFLLAIVEMELDKLSESEHDFISVYLDKLRLQNTQINSFPLRMGSMKDSIFSSEAIACTEKNGNELTKSTIRQLIARQTVVSCISTIQIGLDVLSNAIRRTSWTESDKSFLEDQEKCNKTSESAGGAEISIDIVTWNCWKSKNLSYFLDRRTVALVSGSSLMFSAPQIQWIQVLERLNISTKSSDDDLVETIELLLLGCIASKWTSLIEYFMSVTYDSLSVSRLYHDVCNLLPGRCQSVYPNGVAPNTKESAILEYLLRLLGGQLHLLWKLPPILSAIAIPYWSPLFRLCLTEIETEFKGDSSKMRYRCCTEHNKEDGDGQLAERIWCLYIFHVCGSHVLYGTNDP